MSCVLYYDFLDPGGYKGAPTANWVNADPTTYNGSISGANGMVTDVTTRYRDGENLPWNVGSKTYSKIYELYKPGTTSVWHGWQGNFGGLFTASSGESWGLSFYYKTNYENAGLYLGYFYRAKYPYVDPYWEAYSQTYLHDGTTTMIADGQWHRWTLVNRLDEKMSGSATTVGGILGSGPQWNYGTTRQYLLIGGLQWEYKPYCSIYTPPGTGRSTTVDLGGGAYDLSGNGNHGDLVNCTYTYLGNPTVTTNTNGGIKFTPNSALTTITDTSHTFECWIKNLGTPPGTYGGYFFGREGYHCGFYQDKASPTIFNANIYYSDNSGVTSDNVTVATNAWAHLVMTVDLSNQLMKFYHNGVLISNEQLTVTPTKTLKIYGSATYFFGGAATNYMANIQLGMCKVYNRSLSAAEVSQNYKIGKSKYPVLLQ
jgi:hypothetical protein